MSGKDRTTDLLNNILLWINPFRGIILAVFFVVTVITGILFLRSVNKPIEVSIQEPTVSAVSSAEEKPKLVRQLTVNVSGGVTNPGVYSVDEGSRIIDALEKAGGLSADADTIAIEKSINLAQLLTDGQKLYFPKKGEQVSNTFNQATGAYQNNSGKISINGATQAELDSLPGIGEVRSKAIISNRPYSLTQDLVAKKVLSNSVYQDIKDLISL